MSASQEQETDTATPMPAWQRSAQVAIALDQYREDWFSDPRLQSQSSRSVVVSALHHFADNDCTYQAAFEVVRTASSKLPTEEGRPSDEDVSDAESYFIQLMDEVSGVKRSE